MYYWASVPVLCSVPATPHSKPARELRDPLISGYYRAPDDRKIESTGDLEIHVYVLVFPPL